MRFREKVTIVTGGSRGIGLAIARALATEGATVAIVDKNAETGSKAAAQIEAEGGRACFFQADVSDKGQVVEAVGEIARRFGRIDILVNNAGIHTRAPFTQETRADWLRLFEVNVLGVVFPSQAVVPYMIEQGGGRIVHISSKAAVVGEPGHAAYSASKGAVLSLTRAMAVELAPYHITVNAVCPGPIVTDMLLSDMPEEADRQALAQKAPLGRLGRPEDVAAAVLYLASDEASWCTGQGLSVDGGFSILL
ncbi:MAG: SDR family NAD(P)-dependent oxidoreductase [Anaerolineae bacterium]|nr:SDR family NAD(P)-dependent oxidoreductase [Anaerolineae bacterium]